MMCHGKTLSLRDVDTQCPTETLLTRALPAEMVWENRDLKNGLDWILFPSDNPFIDDHNTWGSPTLSFCKAQTTEHLHAVPLLSLSNYLRETLLFETDICT